MYRFNSAEVKRHAEKYAIALMQSSINDMAWEFKDVEHIITANQRQVQVMANHPDSVMAILKDVVANNNLIMGASLAFDNNNVYSKSGDLMLYATIDSLSQLTTRCITDTTSYNYRAMPWFANAKRTKQSEWSEPYFDEGCGNRLMTTFSIPLTDANGQFYAVLTADVSLLELDKEINDISPFADDFTFVLSGDGNYVAHSKWSTVDGTELYNVATVNDDENLLPIYRKMLNGESGTENVVVDNEDMLVCYAPLSVADWSICYVCPYSSILASLNSFTLSIESSLLLVLLLLIFAMWRIIKHQIKPAEKLTEATYAISKGNFDSPLPAINTNDEFKRLHDAFETMQLSLKQYIADLTAVTEAKQKIVSELRIAHDIQMHLIPAIKKNLHFPHIDCDALLRPAKEVGGDFYDYIIIDNRLYFTIADVSGKGVPASLIMATTRAHFRMMCRTMSSPAGIVSALNNALCVDNDANMFVTMFVGIINLTDNSLQFCNAGHNPAIIITPDGSRFMNVTPNLPLGIFADFSYQEQTVTLPPTYTLLFYTDGLTEAENTQHQLLGEQAVLNALDNAQHLSAAGVVDTLSKCVEAYANGAEQSDDLTLFCIKSNLQLTMGNDVAEVEKLPEFVNESLSLLHINEEDSELKASMLNLALEEAVVNVINYAYPEGDTGVISLTAESRDNSIIFTLTDSGTPFDPTAVAEPNLQASLDERQIGGLGIHLVRNIMASVSYRRVDLFNELTMVFSV
jgi:sigma-B regulation protein RsbU (phosphoserine phosphatase)